VVPDQATNGKSTNIIPMGCLHGVTVDIEGARAKANFEVFKIVDDNNLYPTFVGIDWAFDMNVVINLKKRNMTFEKKELRVIGPLYPTEGVQYSKLL